MDNNSKYKVDKGKIIKSPFASFKVLSENVQALDNVSGQSFNISFEHYELIKSCINGMEIEKPSQKQNGILQKLIGKMLLLDEIRMEMVRSLTFQTIDIEVSGLCNAECTFCPREVLKKGRGVGIMSPNIFESIFKKVSGMVKFVGFVGLGEPTLNKKIIAYVKAFKNVGKSVMIITNGSLLTEHLIDQLISARIDGIVVSFQGMTRESYESHMIGLEYDKVKAKVELMLKKAKMKIPITILAVETARNIHDLKGFAEYWRKKGAMATLVKCHSRGNTITDDIIRTNTTSKNIHQRCSLFNTRSFITWKGELLACCHDVRGHGIIGNLVDEEIDCLIDKKLKVIETRKWFPMCIGCDESFKDKLFDIEKEVNK